MDDTGDGGAAGIDRRGARARGGHRAALGERARARGLPRLGVPHRGGGVPAARAPARRRGDRVRHRAPARRADGRGARAGAHPPLRQPLRFLLRGRPARRSPRRALHPRRRLPALVPLRQLRHAHQPQAAGTSQRIIEYRLSPLYVSVHATDPTRAALPAPQSHRARDPAAAPRVRRPRHPVPHPDRDVAGRRTTAPCSSRRCASCTSSAPPSSAARWCPSGSPSSASTTSCASRRPRSAARPSRLVEARAARGPSASGGIHWAFGADELYLRAGVELPPAEIYDGFDQVENGVGSVRWLQQQIDDGAEALHGWAGPADRRGHRHRHGPAHADGARAAGRARPARSFELIPVVNSLFGPSVTTAGPAAGHGAAGARSRRGAISTWRCFPARRSTTTASSWTA